MALQISEKNGIYNVSGRINTQTVGDFKIHFDYILDHKKKVIINLEDVNEIDEDGLKGLRILSKIARINQKMFFVIGYRTRDFYQNLQNNQSQVA